MEVMIAAPNLDFDFNSARSSPQVSAPSTPKRFGEYYFSAPASPSRLSQYYNDFNEFVVSSDDSGGGLSATVPFNWEEKPGTPKSSVVAPVIVSDTGDHDFVFDVSQDWDTESLTAEDLFDSGVIKPLKPPPPQPPVGSRKISQGSFSPRHNNKGKFPFAVAAQNATKEAAPQQRGRERGVDLSKSSSRRATRSLSPLRDNKLPLDVGEEEPQDAKNGLALSSASSKGQKKWRLKDFFLFRSASEGRAADKDPLKKYTAAVFRRSSFNAIESAGSGSGSRRRGPVSAHELHYTVNRAVSEDLKRKTFLPYKQGILGRLAFNPTAHALANGFGFSRK